MGKCETEKQDRLFVFYSKGEKSGWDIWIDEKLEASYEVEDVPTTTDRNGKYYFKIGGLMYANHGI